MKAWRLFLVIFLLTTMGTMLAGCGGNKSQKLDNAGKQASNETIELKIRSGSPSGSWYPATGAMAEFLPQQIPGLKVTVTPGAGQSNVEAIQNGTANFAFGKAAATYQGLLGLPPFKNETDKVRNIGYLYDEAFHIVVRADSGINSISDLKGKSLTTQTKGNLAEEMTRDVLAAYGLSYDNLKKVTQVGYDDSVQQMKDGLVDAFTFATAIPASVLMDLASVRDVKLLSIDKDKLQILHQKNNGYIERIIPKGTYKGQDKDILTMGSAIHMMVPSTMSDDLVYKLTKAIVENRNKLGEVHSAYKGLTPEKMAQDIGIPFHPGAVKYYKEVGAME